MISEFNKLKHSNNKFIYDIANFYKNSKVTKQQLNITLK